MNRLSLFIAAAWVMSLCGLTLAQDRGAASSIAWSPDGEKIAVGSTSGLWFFDNDFNQLGFVEVELGMSAWPKFVEWNSTGDYVVFANMLTNPISVVDVSKLKVITLIDDALPWAQIRWHPSANHIVSGALGRTHVLDAITGEELFYYDLQEEEPHLGTYESLGFLLVQRKHIGNRTFTADFGRGSGRKGAIAGIRFSTFYFSPCGLQSRLPSPVT